MTQYRRGLGRGKGRKQWVGEEELEARLEEEGGTRPGDGHGKPKECFLTTSGHNFWLREIKLNISRAQNNKQENERL